MWLSSPQVCNGAGSSKVELRRLSWADGSLTDELLDEIGQLRIASWEADGKRPSSVPITERSWTDTHDEHAEHFVVVSGGVIIAASRACFHTSNDALPDAGIVSPFIRTAAWPAVFWNRMVVHPLHRRNGLAERLDEDRLAWTCAAGAQSIFVTTHVAHRCRALEQLGFERIGEAPLRHVPTLAEYVYRMPGSRLTG